MKKKLKSLIAVNILLFIYLKKKTYVDSLIYSYFSAKQTKKRKYMLMFEIVRNVKCFSFSKKVLMFIAAKQCQFWELK